jgi:hypothetical protein
MSIESEFNINPLENPFSGDPSLPQFKFNEKERQEMLDKGMTEDEITAKEVAITTKQIEAKLEQKKAA